MITLHTFGPGFGRPHSSPFVTKAEVLLKLSGQPYEATRADVRKAPKGKLPVIIDDGEVIADSTFIRMHLETKYGIDFDAGLTPAERGIAWAAEKLVEDNLYWAVVEHRWMDDANFDRGPRSFFDPVPSPMRPLVIAMVRRSVRRTLWGQGLGRHSRADIERIAERGIRAVADILGDKHFLMGPKPCGADAAVFGFVTSVLSPLFATGMRAEAERHANLVAYCDRCLSLWYPGLRREDRTELSDH